MAGGEGNLMVAIVFKILLWTAVMAALIFWPAGTLRYPGAWAFVALFGTGGVVMMAWLSKYSPSLLRERMAGPVQRDQAPWDRVFLSLFALAFFGWLPLMAWDAARNGFGAVPSWLQVLGGVAIVLYMLGAWWTFRENAFAAPVVKVQEGQRVIDTGPYALVRHPMYASAVPLFIGLPLLLGSWIGLACAVVFVVGLAGRILGEERTLRSALKGYDDYCARVPYRLLPHVW
jgi:protein-S-isoprenylcysteine O-methyltransferase Ste14